METNHLAKTTQTVLAEGEGLRLQSGPGRDLIFKVTGDDTGGAFDYFIVEVAPRSGPPLHVHHLQEEIIHVLKGHFKIRRIRSLDKCPGFFMSPTEGTSMLFLQHQQDVFLYTKILLPFIPAGHSGMGSLRNLLPLSAIRTMK